MPISSPQRTRILGLSAASAVVAEKRTNIPTTRVRTIRLSLTGFSFRDQVVAAGNNTPGRGELSTLSRLTASPVRARWSEENRDCRPSGAATDYYTARIFS
jgi:hypothetical protein